MREFFLSYVKVHTLHHANRTPIYGVWLIEELRRHGYSVSPGTVYPLLHSLEAAGYLKREDLLVEGKIRKYYRITATGRAALGEARERLHELVGEVVGQGRENESVNPRAASFERY